MKKDDAEEYTQSLGQIVAGSWRQIALAKRLGVPKALGQSVEDWVNHRLGGYVKQSIAERREAAKELADEGDSTRAIAEVLGVDKMTVHRDLNVEAAETARADASVSNDTSDEDQAEENQEVTEDAVSNDTLEPLDTVTTLSADEAIRAKVDSDKAKEEKKKKQKEDIEKQSEEISKSEMPAIENKYHVIAMDPPWPYEDGKETTYDPASRRVANPYPEMSISEIQGLTIPAADDCVMWLWTTHKFLPDSFELLEYWGFDYKATLVWDKQKMGMGHWLRMQCEFCVLAIKGNPLWDSTTFRDFISSPRREHSRKPDEFYESVGALCHGAKIEMFSRECREGWDQYGNDRDKF